VTHAQKCSYCNDTRSFHAYYIRMSNTDVLVLFIFYFYIARRMKMTSCETYSTTKVLLEKLEIRNAKKGTRNVITIFTSFTLGQMNPVNDALSCLFKIHSNIIFPYTPGLPSCFFLQIFRLIIVCISLLSDVCYVYLSSRT
jgi:hypothetical protein